MLEKFKTFFNKLLKTGFFSIVCSNVFSKVVAFVGGMVLVRVLSKHDYGVYSYVNNVLGMLVLLGDMGTGLATMQFAQEHHKNENKMRGVCAFGLKITILFSFLPSLCILLSPYYYPYTMDETISLTVGLAAFPFLNNLNAFLQTNLRIHLQNNKFALLNVLSGIFHYLVLIPLAFFWGTEGAVYACYGYTALTLIVALILNRKILYVSNEDRVYLTKTDKKDFLKFSIPSQINSISGQVMILLDLFFIGLFYTNAEAIASYKVAATIPSACAFIPSCIGLYIMPYLARHKNDMEWVKAIFSKLIKLSVLACAAIAVIAILTAKWCIPLVFGEQYSDAISCYIILMIGFIFSGGFYVPATNTIYSQRKIRVCMKITFLGGILKIVLGLAGIKMFDAIGLAVASSLTNVILGISAFLYMKYLIMEQRKKHD